jgi:hypothetical protein
MAAEQEEKAFAAQAAEEGAVELSVAVPIPCLCAQ